MLAHDTSSRLHAAFELQRAAFMREPFPHWRLRRDRLQRLRALLHENERRIEEAINADFGVRPSSETQLLEIFPSLEEIKSALRHGRRWMQPRGAPMSRWFLPARARIVPQPLGVVGVIVPWNYPLYLSVGPLVGALAAGNNVLLKLSEFTPAFGEWLAAALAERYGPEEVAAVTGDAEVAAGFSRLPFDHLLFTGSTAVGKHVMAAAADRLTPLTLELGGKSPAIIAPGYPLAHAVQRILAGKLANAGQTCIAPDYVLLPRAAMAEFVTLARATARHMYPGGLADGDYCSIVNERHYARLASLLGEAQQGGGECAALFEATQADVARHRLAPQLLVDPAPTLRVMQEEIFGPLLPLVPYDTLDAALARLAAQPRPLALYWFDQERERTARMLEATHAGGVTVNDVLLHIAVDSLPFGGIGASGIGHYHGRWGFETFSKLKPVFLQSRLNALGLFTPPYRPLAQRLLRLMKRY